MDAAMRIGKMFLAKWLWIFALLALGISGRAADFSVLINTNLYIPDGSPGGVFSIMTLTNSVEAVDKVTVSFELASGHDTYNGDYYAFLSHGGKTVVLLNRVGSPENIGFGYADHGFNVVFDDDATNGDVHVYRQVVIRPDTDMSQITGSWVPDGRTNSPSKVLDTNPQATRLADFKETNADGTWILFIADLSRAGTSRLLSWGLNITTSPGTNLTHNPVIASSPTNLTVTLGDPASLAVVANGLEPLGYRWRKGEVELADGAGIGGTSTSLLSITHAQVQDEGFYSVVVSNSFGSATSEVARLTVLLPPEILREPDDTNALRGSDATFAVSASGTEPLAYQWFFLETNLIVEATNTTLIVNDASRNSAGGYSVIIANLAGSITSRVAQLNLRFSLVSSNAASGGAVARNPNQSDFPADSIVELTATPDLGFYFKEWMGDLAGSNNPASLLMDDDKAVEAQFGALRNLSVAAAGQGFVSRHPDTNTFTENQLVILTAQPSNGWQFVEWRGGVSGTQNPLLLVMSNDQSVEAVFRQWFDLEVVRVGQGQVLVDPLQIHYLEGATVNATAVAAERLSVFRMEWCTDRHQFHRNSRGRQ